jgi:hypothetical protein
MSRCFRPRAATWSLALVTVVALGCSEGPTSPAGLAPSFNPTPPPPAARVRVCKDASSPAGTYDFTVSQVGGRGGTLLVGAAFSLGSGECADVWEALPNPPDPDPVVNVTVTELAPPAGIQFDSLVGTSNADGPFFTTGPSWTVRVNYSHAAFYNYFNSATPQGGGEGCTPGYWKQSQHFDSWTAPYTPSTQFSAVFEGAFPSMTLLQVLAQGGGGLNALGRHTVAALLNSASADADYDLTTAQVIAAFNAVFPGGDYEGQKNIFAGFNELGCPLN